MRTIELIWNILYYFIYKTDYKLHLWFNRINPFMLIHKLPFQKKMYEQKGIDIYSDLDYTYKDKKDGISSIRSGAAMFILSFLMSFAVFCFVQSVFNKGFLNSALIVLFAFPFAVLNFYLLFYKNKYLHYFELFDSKPMSWKKKWSIISAIIVFAIIFFLILLFYIMGYSLHHFGFLKK